MVHSPNLFFIANGNNPTGVGFTLGKTICFSSPEFTKDYPGHLSLSPLEGDSGIIFIGMVHSGSPSLDTTLEDSSDEGGAALAEGGSSGSPCPRGCNVVTPTVSISTTPMLENTTTLLTIPMVTMLTVLA
jgi:hypothetical protein